MLEPPSFESPRLVQAAEFHACAVDDNQIKCWGSNSDSIANTPQFEKVSQLSSVYRHACALGDGEVKCWGYNQYGQTDVPSLTNPIQISTGGFHSCALDDSGVVCWGRSEHGVLEIPDFLIELDGDGVPNEFDAFPNDPAAAVDTDGDGYPDNWNEDQSASDSTSNPELVLDAFPNDASRWSETGASPVFNWNPHGMSSESIPTPEAPQDEARVAGLSGGGFVAIWQGKGSSDSYGIYGQRYLADGTTIGNEF